MQRIGLDGCAAAFDGVADMQVLYGQMVNGTGNGKECIGLVVIIKDIVGARDGSEQAHGLMQRGTGQINIRIWIAIHQFIELIQGLMPVDEMRFELVFFKDIDVLCNDILVRMTVWLQPYRHDGVIGICQGRHDIFDWIFTKYAYQCSHVLSVSWSNHIVV